MGRGESGRGVGGSDGPAPAEPGRIRGENPSHDAILREVALGLVDQHDPDRLQETLVETLAASGLYDGIWVGNRLNTTPTAAVGDDQLVEILGEIALASPREEFVTEGRVTTVYAETVQEFADGVGAEFPGVTVGRVPLQARGLACGTLLVATRRENPMDDAERAALADVGRLGGYALDATVQHGLLVGDGSIEVDLEVDHDAAQTGLTMLAASSDETVELERILPRPAGAQLLAHVPDPDLKADALPDGEVLERCTVADSGMDGSAVELVVSAHSPLATLADSAVTVTAATATPDSLRLTVRGGATGTEILRRFQAQFPSVTCLAKRQVSRTETDGEQDGFLARATLTEKQKRVLEVALAGGFFERPRNATGQELADSLDISASTFHQHLRDGLRKVVQTAIEE